MQFKYNINNQLPPLAWFALIAGDTINVECGNAVACNDQFFVSGAWAGNFADGDFLHSDLRCMTGCSIANQGISFSTSSYPQETMFSMNTPEGFAIANSLPLLLAATDSKLDRNFFHYEEALNSVAYGRLRYIKNVPVITPRGKQQLNLHICCTLDVATDGSFKATPIATATTFSTFDEYHNAMSAALRALRDNATDPARTKAYGMVSTISRGYDATAASALCRELGCDTTLTFNRPVKYAEDCGSDIARKMGYTHVIEGDANEVFTNEQLWEAEAAAGGDISLVVFDVFSKQYTNCMLFMGVRGDSMWDKTAIDRCNENFDYGRMKISNPQNPEHWLRTNTILVSVPLIFGDHWPQIAHVSNLDEMKPYSVGGNYDRPIPRKLVEDMGIERNEFGMSKKGAGYTCHFDTVGRMARKMSLKSFNSFSRYCRDKKGDFIPRVKNGIIFYTTEVAEYVNRATKVLKINYSMKRNEHYHSGPASALLVQWGVDTLRKQYKKNLNK